ncbi:MAG: spore gernimation protein GerPD [Tumebacillaceae bacterium]
MKVKLEVTNGDLQIGDIKINSISSSSILIFGDAKSFYPSNVSISRGVQTPKAILNIGPGGPVGAIR